MLITGLVLSTVKLRVRGNAAFLAGYLLVAVGLGVYYYFNEARKNYKYFALAAVGLNLIVLMLTSNEDSCLVRMPI